MEATGKMEYEVLRTKPEEISNGYLQGLMQRLAHTEYGREHNFKDVHDYKSFAELFPVTDCSHFLPYFEREIGGETDVIVPKGSVALWGTTSGTTGKAKRLAVSKEILKRSTPPLHQAMYQLIGKYMPKDVPASDFKMIQLYTMPPEENISMAADGTFIGPVSTLVVDMIEQSKDVVCSPLEVYTQIYDAEESNFVHAAFALAEKDIIVLTGTFITNVLPFLMTIQKNWRSLVAAIRTGELKMPTKDQGAETSSTLSAAILAEFATRANPSRAAQLEGLFLELEARANEDGSSVKDGWTGFAKRVWPRLSWLNFGMSGPFKMYVEDVRHWIGQDVAFDDYALVSTEGFHMIKDVGTSHFLFNGYAGFYELVKEEDSHLDNPPAIPFWKAEIGRKYEYAVTNDNGFVRMRVGDIVEAKGRTPDGVPVFELLYRKGSLLNVRGEKTSIEAVTAALNTVLKEAFPEKTTLVDFTTSLDLAVSPPRYEIFFEASSEERDGLKVATSEQLSEIMELALRQEADLYSEHRDWNNLAPLVCKQVKAHGFKVLRAALIKRGAATSQVKIPRKLPTAALVKTIKEQCVGGRGASATSSLQSQKADSRLWCRSHHHARPKLLARSSSSSAPAS